MGSMTQAASVVRTTCRFCLVRCGMLVETGDGKPHVKGDRAHPLSRGYLCPKGKASVDMTLSPKRLLYPLRRDGARGSGQWRRVSWDEALDDIAARLNAIIARHGARAVAVQSLPPKDYFAYDLFLDAIGSPTFFKHDSHQCFTPQLIADVLTYGNLFTYPAYTELKGTDLAVLWGINLAETNASKHQRVRDAVRRGCRTIVVDPRPTQAAREATLWLRVRPGTDAALALGMIHVMTERGWYDREFVADWTLGFEALAARAVEYPPARVAEITWVPAGLIVEAARLVGEAKRPALYTFIGATMGGNSVATLRLMGFIPALAGKIDRPGTNGFLPPTGVRMPSYYGADPALGRARRLDEMLSADKFPLFAGPKAITAPYPHPRQVIDAMLTGKPYPVKALWTSCNPMVGLEDTCTTMRALQSLDLLVVSELFETPTARLADYVLPITTHLESNAIAEYSGLNMICARVRALEPRGEAREEGWAVIEVARRMGYGERLPVKSYEELLDYRLQPIGITFAQLARQGAYLRPNEFEKFRSGRLRRDGKPGFNTPSGKIEFASQALAAHGYDPLPDFVEPPLSPYSTPDIAREYPLVLVSGTRTVELYSTLGIEVPRLLKRRPYPTLEMSPQTAARLGIREDEWAEISAPTTQRTIVRRVALVEGMHPDVVNAEGLWYMPGEDLIAGTLAVGANVLTPLRDDVDPVIGGSIARCILCRVRALGDRRPDFGRWQPDSVH
jgi:anaerobic selenocysteine-containing dehydrogenase